MIYIVTMFPKLVKEMLRRDHRTRSGRGCPRLLRSGNSASDANEPSKGLYVFFEAPLLIGPIGVMKRGMQISVRLNDHS